MKKNKQTTLESWMLVNGKPGDVFYSGRMDKDITALATHYKKKVSTERILVISGLRNKPTTKQITKITLL